MIVYNGIALESVAGVQIEDVRVSPIQYNPVARERAWRMGSNFVRMLGAARTITISFALLVQNPVERRASLLALSQWAKTDAEHRLELPWDAERFLSCVCTSKPDASTRQWFENKLKFIFTCFDNPYWTDKAEKSVSCGTQFFVGGDAPPIMRIERTVSGSAAANQSYSDGTNTMTFSSIPVGNMVIDLNNQTAAVGGSSIMGNYAPSSRFILPKTGVQTITGTGTIKYRERWE